MKIKALIIDDDEKIGSLLSKFFLGFDIEAKAITSPTQGLVELKDSPYDVVILDIMMPEINGLDLCKEIRTFSNVPIIMLTARGETLDKIIGLEIGADDYMAKPFEPRELVARIQSLIRRIARNEKPLGSNTLMAKDLIVNLNTREVQVENEKIQLTTMEFDILILFMEHPGKVLSRDEVMDLLKGVDWNVFDRSIDINISRLRKKLNDSSKVPRFIKTIWGSGYIFIQEVQKV